MRCPTVLALLLAAAGTIPVSTADARPTRGDRALRRRAPITAAAATVAIDPLRAAWRKTLRRTGVTLDARQPLFHQIRDPGHRRIWQTKLGASPVVPRSLLRAWIGAGNYPGLWTVETADGWYSQTVAGQPVEIRLKEDMVLYDSDVQDHVDVYEAWLADDLAHGPSTNAFDAALSPRGIPLSDRARGVRAPRHEKFYRDLGIAGVSWYDVMGRKCIVLFNAEAIADVRFPDAVEPTPSTAPSTAPAPR